MREPPSHRAHHPLAHVPTVLALAFVISLIVVAPLSANIFTKALREASEAGGKAGKHSIDVPDGAARFLKKLPKKTGHLALTANATPAGHWKFTNAKGDVFTAATPDEMANVAKVLGPEGANTSQKLSLYMNEETLFKRSEFLDALPGSSTHHMVVGKRSYPIEVTRANAKLQRAARIRENVVLPLTTRKAFDEALWQISRTLHKADIRVLALRPGARATLPPVPGIDKKTRQVMVDQIDPDALLASMSAVRGQTLLITGEVRANALHFTPGNGPARSLNFQLLREAATNADVNLIVLQSRSPRQPGGRNWLWQTVKIDGLKDALNRATFADFINALGARGGSTFKITATPQGGGRVTIDAIPVPQQVTVPYSDVVGGWIGEVASNVTGNVVTTALTADVRDKERQSELDNRIIPGIPSIYQMFYLGSLIIGLIAWTVSREVWALIWPPEQRAEYRSSTGYNAARIVKTLIFLFVFLPIAGIPMMVLTIFLQIWTVLGWIWSALTSPLRLWRWLKKRST